MMDDVGRAVVAGDGGEGDGLSLEDGSDAGEDGFPEGGLLGCGVDAFNDIQQRGGPAEGLLRVLEHGAPDAADEVV